MAAATLMVGVDPTGVSQALAVTSGSEPVGGIFIGGDSLGIFAGGALRRISDERAVVVAVDDEGGRVQRLDAFAGDLASPRIQSHWSPTEIRRVARARGELLRATGITVNFAPVVDITHQDDDEVIGDRSYGMDAPTAIRGARAFAAGMRAAGVVPTLKHFPGHGAGTGDSHDSPVRAPALDDLEASDLLPFEALLDDGPTWVMVGHLDVPGLTEPDVPASLSPAAYSYLRDRLGFEGLVVTDELGGMRAVSSRFSAGEAAVRALAAGADVVLFADAAVVPDVVAAVDVAVSAGRLSVDRLRSAYGRVREAQGC